MILFSWISWNYLIPYVFIAISLLNECGVSFRVLAVCNQYLLPNVPDDKITASSEYEVALFPSYQARLSSTSSWAASIDDSSPWIQAAFPDRVTAVAIVTKGLHQYSEWVTSYRIRYSNNGANWKTVKYGSNNVFTANIDSDSLVQNDLPSPITTKFIRIHLVTWNVHPSLRFDVVGCFYEETTSANPKQDSTTSAAPTTTDLHPTTTESTTSKASTPTTTEVQSTTTDISTVQPTTSETSTSVCFCVNSCRTNTLNDQQLQLKIDLIKQKLTILKNNTSRARRTKISVLEYRQSASSIGAVGAGFIATFILVVVFSDMLTLIKFLVKTCKR